MTLHNLRRRVGRYFCQTLSFSLHLLNEMSMCTRNAAKMRLKGNQIGVITIIKKTRRRSSFRILRSLMGSRLFFCVFFLSEVKHLIGLLDRKKNTTRATPTIALHSKQNHSEQLGLTDWQMTDVLLFQRLSEKRGLPHFTVFFRCGHTLPSAALLSIIKGIYCSSRLKLSLSSTSPSPFLLVSGQSPPPPHFPKRFHLAEISATTRQE